MNTSATSLKAFGIYLILIPGLGLMLIPEFILDLFSLHHGNSFWLARMLGLLAFIVGVYYTIAARHKLRELYIPSVILRYFAAFFMGVLWLTGEVEVMILLFAVIDVCGATWTLMTLRHRMDT
ncbi:MAG: hypothetical protein HKN87_20755 [Saprospiraceae bacterium]|nr:hypothetical protein [Saprospiraceae bacterium]